MSTASPAVPNFEGSARSTSSSVVSMDRVPSNKSSTQLLARQQEKEKSYGRNIQHNGITSEETDNSCIIPVLSPAPGSPELLFSQNVVRRHRDPLAENPASPLRLSEMRMLTPERVQRFRKQQMDDPYSIANDGSKLQFTQEFPVQPVNYSSTGTLQHSEEIGRSQQNLYGSYSIEDTEAKSLESNLLQKSISSEADTLALSPRSDVLEARPHSSFATCQKDTDAEGFQDCFAWGGGRQVEVAHGSSPNTAVASSLSTPLMSNVPLTRRSSTSESTWSQRRALARRTSSAAISADRSVGSHNEYDASLAYSQSVVSVISPFRSTVAANADFSSANPSPAEQGGAPMAAHRLNAAKSDQSAGKVRPELNEDVVASADVHNNGNLPMRTPAAVATLDEANCDQISNTYTPHSMWTLPTNSSSHSMVDPASEARLMSYHYVDARSSSRASSATGTPIWPLSSASRTAGSTGSSRMSRRHSLSVTPSSYVTNTPTSVQNHTPSSAATSTLHSLSYDENSKAFMESENKEKARRKKRSRRKSSTSNKENRIERGLPSVEEEPEHFGVQHYSPDSTYNAVTPIRKTKQTPTVNDQTEKFVHLNAPPPYEVILEWPEAVHGVEVQIDGQVHEAEEATASPKRLHFRVNEKALSNNKAGATDDAQNKSSGAEGLGVNTPIPFLNERNQTGWGGNSDSLRASSQEIEVCDPGSNIQNVSCLEEEYSFTGHHGHTNQLQSMWDPASPLCPDNDDSGLPPDVVSFASDRRPVSAGAANVNGKNETDIRPTTAPVQERMGRISTPPCSVTLSEIAGTQMESNVYQDDERPLTSPADLRRQIDGTSLDLSGEGHSMGPLSPDVVYLSESTSLIVETGCRSVRNGVCQSIMEGSATLHNDLEQLNQRLRRNGLSKTGVPFCPLPPSVSCGDSGRAALTDMTASNAYAVSDHGQQTVADIPTGYNHNEEGSAINVNFKAVMDLWNVTLEKMERTTMENNHLRQVEAAHGRILKELDDTLTRTKKLEAELSEFKDGARDANRLTMDRFAAEEKCRALEAEKNRLAAELAGERKKSRSSAAQTKRAEYNQQQLRAQLSKIADKVNRQRHRATEALESHKRQSRLISGSSTGGASGSLAGGHLNASTVELIMEYQRRLEQAEEDRIKLQKENRSIFSRLETCQEELYRRQLLEQHFYPEDARREVQWSGEEPERYNTSAYLRNASIGRSIGNDEVTHHGVRAADQYTSSGEKYENELSALRSHAARLEAELSGTRNALAQVQETEKENVVTQRDNRSQRATQKSVQPLSAQDADVSFICPITTQSLGHIDCVHLLQEISRHFNVSSPWQFPKVLQSVCNARFWYQINHCLSLYQSLRKSAHMHLQRDPSHLVPASLTETTIAELSAFLDNCLSLLRSTELSPANSRLTTVIREDEQLIIAIKDLVDTRPSALDPFNHDIVCTFMKVFNVDEKRDCTAAIKEIHSTLLEREDMWKLVISTLCIPESSTWKQIKLRLSAALKDKSGSRGAGGLATLCSHHENEAFLRVASRLGVTLPAQMSSNKPGHAITSSGRTTEDQECIAAECIGRINKLTQLADQNVATVKILETLSRVLHVGEPEQILPRLRELVDKSLRQSHNSDSRFAKDRELRSAEGVLNCSAPSKQYKDVSLRMFTKTARF